MFNEKVNGLRGPSQVLENKGVSDCNSFHDSFAGCYFLRQTNLLLFPPVVSYSFELISQEQSYFAMAFGPKLTDEIAPFQQMSLWPVPVVNRIGFNGSFITSPTAVDGVHFS